MTPLRPASQKTLQWSLALLGCLWILNVPLPALAAKSSRIGIQPANGNWFVLNLTSSATTTQEAIITNYENTAQTVLLYPVDAETTTEGGFAPLASDAPRLDVSTWIQLPFDHVELKPKEARKVAFTMTVPANASPGDHFGALIVEPTTPDKEINQSGSGLSTGTAVVTRVGARIYVTVAGERHEKFRLGDVTTSWEGDDLDIKYEIENQGNVRISPALTVTVHEHDTGRVIQTINYPQNSLEVFPGKTITPATRWTQARNHGKVDIEVGANWGSQDEHSSTQVDTGNFSSPPKQVTKEDSRFGVMIIVVGIGLFLLLLTILVFLGTLSRRVEELAKKKAKKKRARKLPESPIEPTA